MFSDGGHTGDNNPPDPSSQVTGPIYAEISDEESKDPTYASVGVATGKYTYNITTNTSYNTVMLHNMNPTGDNNPPDPSSQVTGPIYAEITDEESTDPTYASVEVATGKYTYNITTNSSYNTVMLHNMNPNLY